MPFLSVMIPVYNGEKLISQAIESVLSQPCTDLELIIMDDGSTDNTYEVCKSYANTDNRVKLFTHENVGLGKNRNMSYPYLSGEWTIFLDHDDLILKDFYTEHTKQFLKKCSLNKIQLIYPSRLRFDYSLSRGILESVPNLGVVNGGNEYSWIIKHEFASLIYDTHLIKDNNLFFYEGRPEVETRFRHQAVYCAKRVLFAPKLFFSVRRNNHESITHKWNWVEIIPVRIDAYDKLTDWHIQYNASDTKAVDDCRKYVTELIKDYVNEMKVRHYPKKTICSQLDNNVIKKYLYEDELNSLIASDGDKKKGINLSSRIIRKVKNHAFHHSLNYFENICRLKFRKRYDSIENIFIFKEKNN